MVARRIAAIDQPISDLHNETNTGVNDAKGVGRAGCRRNKTSRRQGLRTGDRHQRQYVAEVIERMIVYLLWAKARDAYKCVLVNRSMLIPIATNLIETALSGINVGMAEIHAAERDHHGGLRKEASVTE